MLKSTIMLKKTRIFPLDCESSDIRSLKKVIVHLQFKQNKQESLSDHGFCKHLLGSISSTTFDILTFELKIL